jgi:hypothetical protein
MTPLVTALAANFDHLLTADYKGYLERLPTAGSHA